MHKIFWVTWLMLGMVIGGATVMNVKVLTPNRECAERHNVYQCERISVPITKDTL